jgi:hypothetical protein
VPFGGGPSLRLDRAAHFIEADQREGIPIDVFETGEGATPCRRLIVGWQPRRRARRSRRFIGDAPQSRCAKESDATAMPLAVGSRQVLGDEHHLRRTPDQLRLQGMRRRLNQGQHRAPVTRRYRDLSLTRVHASVERDLKPQLVDKESKAPFLIPHVDVHGVHAQERIACTFLV